MAKEKKEQIKWIELEMCDLRHQDEYVPLKAPELLKSGENAEEALRIIMEFFGIKDEKSHVIIPTIICDIAVHGYSLPHIVEKRANSRERYGRFVMMTIENPCEVWKVAYDDNSYRLAFIGLFEGNTQMLVVTTFGENEILWNFMNCEKKTLNKHRHGELLYQANQNSVVEQLIPEFGELEN